MLNHVSERRDLEFDIVDLRDYPLPFYDEPFLSPAKNEVGQRWAEKIESLDGFIFVTAEYNHSIPGVRRHAAKSAARAAGAPRAASSDAPMLLRNASTSRIGGAPNIRAYSRLNCDALSYPTRYAVLAASVSSESRICRACVSRRRFRYCSGLIAVTALK